jgi:hypothetical protein
MDLGNKTVKWILSPFKRSKFLSISVITFSIIISSFFLALTLAQNKQNQRTNAYAENWYNQAWQYRKTITINHTKVSSDQTDFPVLISLPSDTDLATNVRPDGFDLVFTASDGTKLSHERERYSSTGQYVAWVKVPLLSSTKDTVVYVYYGNALSCDQTLVSCDATKNALNVWSNNYKAVYHLKENPTIVNCSTTKEVCDSVGSSNADNTGSLVVGSQVSGKIDGASIFNGTTNYLTVPATTKLQNSTNMTYEGWLYWNGSNNSYSYIIDRGSKTAKKSYAMSIANSSNKLTFGLTNSSGKSRTVSEPRGSMVKNQWIHVAIVFDDTNNIVRFYKNGVQTGYVSTTDSLNKTYSSPLLIGQQNTTTKYPWKGILDELRIVGVALPASWIVTEYNNQNDPQTFYLLGLQEQYTVATPISTEIPPTLPLTPVETITPTPIMPTVTVSQTPVSTTPVGINGQLHVCGTKVCNQYGKPIQLRGMSTHGLQWYGWGDCLTPASIDALANDWKADILRISLYVQEDGYEINPIAFKAQVDQIFDQAVSKGIYAILDWHMLDPGDPVYNLTRAKEYFSYMAQKHGNTPNVIYEIANEPSGVSWATIKSYAEQVIPVIRQYDPDGIIVIGTRAWSSLGISEDGSAQEIVDNPVNGINLMYTFHFYAASHKDEYRNELAWAADRLPIFVTEWGSQTYTGDGTNDFISAQAYIDLMANKQISWTNWNYSDDSRSGAVFKTNTCPNGPFTGTTRLKPAGVWVRDKILNPVDNFPL